MALTNTLTIIDKGWKKIVEQIKLADNSHTLVGVQKGTKRNDDSKISDMVKVASINEFGAPKASIPARPN